MAISSLFWHSAAPATASRPAYPASRRPRLWAWALAASLFLILFQLLNHLTSSGDYVGIDPDDTMRLVQVRDFLAGQGWFDLHQYRLGLDGGTLMHWSRLVDLPIAGLIRFFALFAGPEQAEALALAAWPLLLIVPLMAAIATAGYRLGGTQTMLAALALGTVMTMEMIRFRVGAIDHHNIQIVLVVTIAACLIDNRMGRGSFALAGLAGALALAVGAETTPIVAVAAIIVAVLWAVRGVEARNATLSFAAAIGLGSLALYAVSVPFGRMATVTCDSFSFGYLALTVAGASLLFLAALAASAMTLVARAGALAGIGVLVGMMAVTLMPHCLINPLGELDPLLVRLWLGSVTEARPITTIMAKEPAFAGSFYALGILGLATALFRIRNRDRVQAHAILAGLTGIALLITFLQVRGMVFSNALGIIILSALIVDIRRLYLARPGQPVLAAAFAIVTLTSIPAAWSFAGAMILKVEEKLAPDPQRQAEEAFAKKPACGQRAYLEPVAGLPPGRIMAASNIGSALLRFTGHGVLAAPYHRNQAGMLAELKAGMAPPAEAEAIMRSAGVTILVFCRWDPLIRSLARKAPDGLYARLSAGHAPDFLALQPKLSNQNMATFILRPAQALAANDE